MNRAIELLAPDQRGQNDLKLADGWEKRLEQVGIHPQILAIIDENKWMLKQLRWDANHQEKRRATREQPTM
jgi:hypothetical protein